MIQLDSFFKNLKEKNISFFTGVPDSLLKPLCAYITDKYHKDDHIIAANEGASIGIATGYHLATGNIPMVYMQNSGIGNATNPLLSLADKDVYSIPMLVLVGLRGEPGIKDEPQHIKQGKVSKELFNAMEIPCEILSQETDEAISQINKAIKISSTNSEPVVLLIKKNTFESYSLDNKTENKYTLSREESIELVLDKIGNHTPIISTTGMISRELFEIREKRNEDHAKDFLTVGSMGHASQIALGIALQNKEKKVFCFDGDGATIMHTGSMGIIGNSGLKNYKHIIFNNGAHDSVGGQPTVGFDINICEIAKGFGYKNTYTTDSKKGIEKIWDEFIKNEGPSLLEIRVKKGARKDLGRPTKTPLENKKALMDFLKEY